jgi:curved DNA-binding protein
MSVNYKDYYKLLNVSRTASADEIQKAYRKLAREYHPDRNKSAGAEDKFKEVTEAYEVLRDKDTRTRYDSLGSSFKAGQTFKPPPGFEHIFKNFDVKSGGPRSAMEGGEGFSSFYESLFGDLLKERGGAGQTSYTQARQNPFSKPTFGGSQSSNKSKDIRSILEIGIEQALLGGEQTVTLDASHLASSTSSASRSLKIKIPPYSRDGAIIRLVGQGAEALDGTKGDLLLTLRVKQNAKYSVEGIDLIMKVPIAPWELIFGSVLTVSTLEGVVKVKVSERSQGGKRLRIREKGFTGKEGKRGDLLLELQAVVPTELTSEEEALWRKLEQIALQKKS